MRLMRDDPQRSMPEWIAYPMRDRDDWERIVKPRLDAKVPGRGPEGAERGARDRRPCRSREYPLSLWCGSFYGWPRSFMGVERMSLMLYDDPGLVHEMCEHIADFVIEAISPLLDRITFDAAYIWEDMAGKAGTAVLAGAVPRVHAPAAQAGHQTCSIATACTRSSWTATATTTSSSRCGSRPA